MILEANLLKATIAVFAVAAVMIASMGAMPIFGQTQEAIAITTDKTFYMQGEVIKVSGEVRDVISGTDVTMIVKSPSGNLVSIGQLTVDADKKFTAEITSGGVLMNSDGFYTISVVYGNTSRSAEITFELDVESSAIDTISMEGSKDLIEYEISGGKLKSITPDVDASSLIISIDATDDGKLTLTIPRSIFDSVKGGNDAEVFVFTDENEVNFVETTTSKDRTLVINFPAGTETIDIVGTFVIPEFGTIAAMILAVAIISIIAVSAKSKLSIIPRY